MHRKKILLLVVVAAVVYSYFTSPPGSKPSRTPSSQSEQRSAESVATLAEAFSKKQSDIQVSGHGVVTKVLPDDTSGSRHQKFILRLSSGQTLLVAHNIDLAPRIPTLKAGDAVRFYGEYEWNQKGGVLHWTHRDPNGSHAHGWLEHEGQRYQ